jgi:hypothetical protein
MRLLHEITKENKEELFSIKGGGGGDYTQRLNILQLIIRFVVGN